MTDLEKRDLEKRLVVELDQFMSSVDTVIELMVEKCWDVVAEDMEDIDIGWYRPCVEYSMNNVEKVKKLVDEYETSLGIPYDELRKMRDIHYFDYLRSIGRY
jgi:hypothetical protein